MSNPDSGDSSSAVTASHARDSAPSREERSALDCFNDDLIWILDKLVHRTGAGSGVISGHVAEEPQPTILARSTGVQEQSPLILSMVALGATTPAPRRFAHDTPELSEGVLELSGGDTSGNRRYQTLQLSFLPAPNVRVVATVSKESRFGFSFIELGTARRLYPVLSRYVRLWWMHRAERRRAMTLSAAVDMSDVGILLLNRDGRLLFANSRASKTLGEQAGLRCQDRSITAASESERPRFQAALVHALTINQTSCDKGRARRPAPVIQLRREAGRRDLIVTIVGVEHPAVDTEDPAIIVYVLDPDQEVEQLLAPVCGIYKLTAAEARLVHHLVGGRRISEAAERMHIRPQTARAYLKQVFGKTMTHRQADLVRVMLTSAMRTNASVDLALM